MSDHLLRAHAPISEAAWARIDEEAKERLRPQLAARRLVDWNGPHGWEYSATNLGRIRRVDAATDQAGEVVAQREILPVTEFRVEFTVSREELENATRGAVDLELDDLERAARRAAECENRAVLHGWPTAGIQGITERSPHPTKGLGQNAAEYPHVVAMAVDTLRSSGIAGPFALAVGPTAYTRIAETMQDGGPMLDHLREILGGEVVWAPGVEGGVVLTRRGGDFVIDVGQDFSIGYLAHDAEQVRLYLVESFTFRVVEPDAAVALTA